MQVGLGKIKVGSGKMQVGLGKIKVGSGKTEVSTNAP